MEENIGNKLLDINFGDDFFVFATNNKGKKKSKIKQMAQHQPETLLYSKGNNQQN